MKFKISHALIDTLEDRDNLHASITRIRAFLLNTLGQETFTVADINLIRANLLVHECFSMIGIPNRAKLNSPLHLKDEVKKLFNGEESLDPFTHTKFEITQNSIEFQDKILAAEVLESQGKWLKLFCFIKIFYRRSKSICWGRNVDRLPMRNSWLHYRKSVSS